MRSCDVSVQLLAHFEHVALYVNLTAMTDLVTVTCYSAKSAVHVCTYYLSGVCEVMCIDNNKIIRLVVKV